MQEQVRTVIPSPPVLLVVHPSPDISLRTISDGSKTPQSKESCAPLRIFFVPEERPFGEVASTPEGWSNILRKTDDTLELHLMPTSLLPIL